MSEVRRPRVRAGNDLCLRKFGRPKQDVRLSSGQGHPATTRKSRAGEKTPRYRQDRFTAALHFPQRQAVLSIPGTDRQERRGLRIRKARAKAKKRTEAKGTNRQDRFLRSGPPWEMSNMRRKDF